MKKISLIMAGMMLIGCRLVETANQPVKYEVLIDSKSKLSYQVWHMKKPGQFEEIAPNSKGLYVLEIPSMHGGYKQFLFIKYNVSDPTTYKVVEIRDNQKKLLELSIQDLEKLNKNDNGNRILLLH